ncbi:DUF3048 domain-containing protein [Gudongella sp. DL1XJH-153]|uniref:DUF3048 domain-containing protein n=1 Tax=Gudongella sp. DL1XJH-153 TaxID=3409804 RepID=UPI003BB6B10C
MDIRKILTLIMVVIMSLSLIACNNNQPSEEPELPVEIPAEEPESVPEPEPEPEPEPSGIPSPLSGIYAEEEIVNGRIISIIFDNHPKAKWQSGLKDAEVIYEFPVEGPYTRYLGLYLINNPESVGPIRSARPYFVTMALQFDAIFVHVGGSEQAKVDVRNLNLGEIDGLTSSSRVFWRMSHKRAPNNMYSSMEVLRDVQEERGFRDKSEYEGFVFDMERESRIGQSAEEVSITYNDENNTRFVYDAEIERYERYKDGTRHVDESDESGLYADNIIIQENSMRVLDNVGRLGIAVEGEGEGKYISRGVVEDIKWVKDNRKAKIYYLDKNNEEIKLTPGTTWIQVVKPMTPITIE